MRIRLDETGRARGGRLTVDPRERSSTGFTWRALQVGDLATRRRQGTAYHDESSVRWPDLRRLPGMPGFERHQVFEGDLLVPLRSQPLRALVARGVPDRVLALGHWLVLTVDPDRALAPYLAWYLDHPNTISRIKRDLWKGSKVQFMPLTGLKRMLVDLPELPVQRRIVRVVTLQDRARALDAQLSSRRQELLHASTWSALQRSLQSDP